MCVCVFFGGGEGGWVDRCSSTVQKLYNAVWGGGSHACAHLQDDLAASVLTLCLQYQDGLLGLVWRALSQPANKRGI